MIVARGGDRDAQQVLIFVHGLDNRSQEEQKLQVAARRLARLEQILARVGRDRPVIVLARPVDALERLFVEQADEAVPFRHTPHDLHGELVVVGGDVGRGEHRRHLMLAGGDLVVLSLGKNTELPQLLVQLLHKRRHTRTDGTEVVILHLLPLGRHGAEQRAAGEDQVLALGIVRLVDQEVFLFRPDRGRHALDVLAEQLEHAARLRAERVHRAQQRGLFVQNFARIGAERGGDVQGAVLNESVAGRVPGRVATRLEGRAQAAGGERGRVRLAADQLLSGKLHHDPTVVRRGNERVVLLSRDAGQRLEPVRIMRCAL